MAAPNPKLTKLSVFARVPEAETFLGVSDDSIRAAIKRGDLAAFKLAKTTLIWRFSLYEMAGEKVPPIEWPTGVGTADQVAELLRLNPLLIRSHLRNGDLPGYRVGRVHRVRWEKLKTFLEQLTSDFRLSIQSGSTSASNCEVSHGK